MPPGVDTERWAESVQRVPLQPVPQRLGAVRAGARQLAGRWDGPADSGLGGDFYEVVDTPFGIRLILGDARGAGPDAVGLAAVVLRGFRELVQHEPTLAGVAERLDRMISGSGPEEFVTALLAGLTPAGADVEVVFCGHLPPLLLRDGRVTVTEALVPAPPLGLLGLTGGWYAGETLPFRSGDRLLFYTDGVTEARDARGIFYPLERRVAGLLSAAGDPAPGELLVAVETDLLRYTGGTLCDDAALLVLHADRRCPATWAGSLGDLR